MSSMSELDQQRLVLSQAIDMCDDGTADIAEARIRALLGQVGANIVRIDDDPVTTGDVISPLDELQSVGSGVDLTPEMVQRAINLLDPNSSNAASDAEIVLGYATFGQSLDPENAEWSNVVERANKVYRHRLSTASL